MDTLISGAINTQTSGVRDIILSTNVDHSFPAMIDTNHAFMKFRHVWYWSPWLPDILCRLYI